MSTSFLSVLVCLSGMIAAPPTREMAPPRLEVAPQARDAARPVEKQPAAIPDETREEIQKLAGEARSGDRGVWMPAAARLEALARRGEALRAAVWESARVNEAGIRFVEIPAGMFEAGRDVHRLFGGRPARQVRIARPFFLGATEVTNGQFAAAMESHTPDKLSPDEDSPVVSVSRSAAEEFCRRLSAREGVTYRLPTEEEWEHACRAGTKTRFSFGDSPADLDDYGWWNDRSGGRAAKVALLKPNAWGLYDMHGNAAEWAGTGGEADSVYVVRGGAWAVKNAWACASSARSPYPLFEKKPFSDDPKFGQQVGFRVMREIAPREIAVPQTQPDAATPPAP